MYRLVTGISINIVVFNIQTGLGNTNFECSQIEKELFGTHKKMPTKLCGKSTLYTIHF
jgi:hypothetical protein